MSVKKPMALRELHGTANNNKFRNNDEAPHQPELGIGPAPEFLNVLERDIWDEVVGNLYPGLLGPAERIPLTLLVQLTYRMRYAAGGDLIPLSAAESGQLIKLFSLFGMTPVDRERVKIPKKKKKNGFDGM